MKDPRLGWWHEHMFAYGSAGANVFPHRNRVGRIP
jgi:hypothetical protein